jgi:hypothetical protein
MSIDYAPLLNPKKPPPIAAHTIDTLSWALPVAAATLAGGSAIMALQSHPIWTAVISLLSAAASLLSIRFITWGTAVRDRRLANAEIMTDVTRSQVDYLEQVLPMN